MASPLWKSLFERAGLTLDEAKGAQIDRYLDLLSAGNERMNLTRISDRDSAELLHVADALTLLPHLPPGEITIADVGSGGGVPGVLLAIARPDAKVTLIEATQKKAAFLSTLPAELKLPNLFIEPLRVEDVGGGLLRETFDVAAARAVATMNWLAEWMLPLVKKGGWMLAMKGPRVVSEMQSGQKAMTLVGGGIAEIIPADLPDNPGHVIVKVQKRSRAPSRYPRPASIAKGLPIGERE
jgi:16S rRNA (guanine527-N7)-methyltransferase